MLLDLYFHHQNSAPRSGVSRLWLVEYYTREWEALRKREEAEAKPVEVAAEVPQKRTRKLSKKVLADRKEREITAKVDKAERDLDVLAQGIGDIEQAHRFTRAVIAQAQRKPSPETDFLAIAQEYRDAQRKEDEDLLLLSLII